MKEAREKEAREKESGIKRKNKTNGIRHHQRSYHEL
jgi:hypothetical protein